MDIIAARFYFMIEVIENIRYNRKAGFLEKVLKKIIGYRKEEKEWKIRKGVGWKRLKKNG